MSRQGHAMRPALLLAILGLALSGSGPVAAAATDPAPAPEQTSTDPETADVTAAADEPAVPEDADPDGPGDVFVPTEEISEDYAVSFPVDI